MTMTLKDETVVAIKAFEAMLLTRYMDDKCFKLSRQNKGGTFQLSVAGHELVGVAYDRQRLQRRVDDAPRDDRP